MKMMKSENRTLWTTGLMVLSFAGWETANASTIPMPAGARSWILVSGSDCDDDGPNANIDRGHCIGAVEELSQAGDLGHDIFANYMILANVRVGPETIRGTMQVAGSSGFSFLDVSKIDTFTLNSNSIPAGTVVPITVTFHGVANMIPGAYGSAWGGGTFAVKIGNYMNPDPVVIPENSRVNQIGPNASAQFYQFPSYSPTIIPLDLTAFHAMDVTVGVPFDLAFYLAARPIAATIDFSNTATIDFTVPDGTFMTSTGGYGQAVPVQSTTWGALKARHN